jgi:hypothetical protein
VGRCFSKSIADLFLFFIGDNPSINPASLCDLPKELYNVLCPRNKVVEGGVYTLISNPDPIHRNLQSLGE